MLHQQQDKKDNNNWDIHADNFVITNLVSNMSVKYATNFKQENGKQHVAKIFLPDNFVFACTI